MPVDVKSYLASMKSISSQNNTSLKTKSTNQQNVKMQALLAQLIEALSYAKSMDFRQKTLNAPAVGSDDKTAREVLKTMKDQEKLVKQLADGQALSKEQGEKLTKAIDKFYEMAGTTEINYKKFSENLKKFAEQDLPEAVKTRIANDSLDASLISKDQKSKENPVLNTLKKIKNYVEDSVETTKQFRKKLFVTLDQFKEGLFDAFNKFGEDLASGDLISKLLKNLSGLGALGLMIQGFNKDGVFGIPMLIKQFKNLQVLAKGGKFSETVNDMFKGIKAIFKQFKFLPKLVEKLGLGKGLSAAAKGIGSGIVKGMGKNFLKKIPVIGSLISIAMAISRWKQGDKAGALIELASGAAALFPGIGTLASIGLDLINFGRDSDFFENIGNSIANTGQNIKSKLFFRSKSSERGFGDTRGSIAQFGKGDKVDFGDKLAQSAVAIGGKNTSSTGYCALKVGDAIERTDPSIIRALGRGNAWTWINKLKGPGKKWFNYAGKAKSNRDLSNLAPGSIAVWNKQPAHPYGHIEIADGRGHLISDFSRPANLSLYRSNPAGITPDIFTPKGVKVPKLSKMQEQTSGPADIIGIDETAEDTNSIKTYDDAMSAYTSFIGDLQNKIDEGNVSAATASSAMPIATSMPTQTSRAQAPVSQQVAPASMTTDINDTALAILNSVLFK